MDWEPHDRHWIRLRGPWEAVLIDDAEGARRIKLPQEWVSFCQAHTGRAQFRRRFQQPTQLGPDERVVITLTNLNTDVIASINGQPLRPLAAPLGAAECQPAESCVSFDVTQLLQMTNALTLELCMPCLEEASRIGLHEPVLMEIICVDDDSMDSP